MKSIFIALCLFVAAAGFAPANARSRRDVSEIVSDTYLPPPATAAESEPAPVQADVITVAAEEQQAAPAATATAALGENGYEYRAVRKLIFRNRNRRDVSHLNLEYLPPTNGYLPPVLKAHTAPGPQRLSNEYLPPLPAAQLELVTEATATIPEATVEHNESGETITEIAPEETAVLAADGYHYKRPEVVPDLAPATTPAPTPETTPAPTPAPTPAHIIGEYLPPLEDGVVVAEGPEEDTAVLAEDGYHYRAIRRIRF